MAQVLHYERTRDGTSQRGLELPKVSVAMAAGVQWVVHNVLEWNERSRQRQALAELDDHLLEDIGISRTAANAEASKAFWR